MLRSFFIILTVLSCIAIVGPAALAAAEYQNYLYIAGANGNVTVINTVDNREVATISGVSAYGHIAASPDGKKVYVSGGDEINVIDTSNNTVRRVATGYSSYWDIAVNPLGNEYYVGVQDSKANNYRPLLLVLNAYTDKEIMRFNTSPHGTAMNIAVSPDGTKLYVCSQKTMKANITLYDLTSRAEVYSRSILLSDDIALHPYGREFFVACADGEQFTTALYAFNATSNSEKYRVDNLNWPTGVAASPDGSRLFITNNLEDSLTVLHAASGSEIGTISLGRNYPDKIAITPDGKKMFISHGRDVNGVSLINLTDYSVSFISVNNSLLHEMTFASVPVKTAIFPHLPTIAPGLILSPTPAPTPIPSPSPSATSEPSAPPLITGTATPVSSATPAPFPESVLPATDVTASPVVSASPALPGNATANPDVSASPTVPAATPGFEAVMVILCLAGTACMGRKK